MTRKLLSARERQRRISEGLKASWKRRRLPPPTLAERMREVYKAVNWAALSEKEREAYKLLCDAINTAEEP